jgi:hypothetical protein
MSGWGWNGNEKLCSSLFREGSREVSHKVYCHRGGLKDLEEYFSNINIQEARGRPPLGIIHSPWQCTSSSVSVVINYFHARTGARKGAEKALKVVANLPYLRWFQTNSESVGRVLRCSSS